MDDRPVLRARRIAGRTPGVLAGALVDPTWWLDTVDEEPAADVVQPEDSRAPAPRLEPAPAPPSSLQPPAAFHVAPPLTGGPMGTLQLDVQPPTAGVYVDGFSVGSVDALQAGLHLAAGWHRVEFRADGFLTATANVTIEANRVLSYRFTLVHP